MHAARSTAIHTRERHARVSAWLEIFGLLLVAQSYHLYHNLIGHLASLRGVDYGPLLVTPLDAWIGYIPELVWAYQLAYLAPAAMLLMLLARLGPDVVIFRRIFVSLVTLLSIHFVLYLLLPTSGAWVRLPDAALGEGLSAELVRVQYRLATTWCACPSLHVSGCWLLYRVVAPHYPRARLVWLGWLLLMWAGTASIKIHYAVDGILGLTIAELVYRNVLLRLVAADACRRELWRPAQRALVHVTATAVLLTTLAVLTQLTRLEGPLYRLLP